MSLKAKQVSLDSEDWPAHCRNASGRCHLIAKLLRQQDAETLLRDEQFSWRKRGLAGFFPLT
jgi:hypothetical protein